MKSTERPPSEFFRTEFGLNGKNGHSVISEGHGEVDKQIPLQIQDFVSCATAKPDGRESLLGNNWCFRGGWGALIGPTGQGKTSLCLQAAACWATGSDFVGIAPNGALRILFVQIENGALDLHEMASGILEELQIPDMSLQQLGDNLTLVTPAAPSPDLFGEEGEIAELIRKKKPDLVILDSLYKWLARGTAADPEGVVDLIDRKLLPLCREVNCGALVSHHMGRAEVERIYGGKANRMTDHYAGAGGMFVADSARATLLLVPEETSGHYTLRAAKRASRIGWRNDDGSAVSTKFLAWAEGHIGWREIDGEMIREHRDERTREKKRAHEKLFQEQVLWAIREVASGRAWVERAEVGCKCRSEDGPLPEGLGNTKFLEVVKQMVSEGVLETEEQKNASNRNAAFIRTIS